MELDDWTSKVFG